MKIFGIILFLVGALLLFIGAVTGSGGIANLPATLVGSSFLISGSILGAIGIFQEQINKNFDELKSIIGIPERKLPTVEKRLVDESDVVNGVLVEKKEKTVWAFNEKVFSTEDEAKEAEVEYRKRYIRD